MWLQYNGLEKEGNEPLVEELRAKWDLQKSELEARIGATVHDEVVRDFLRAKMARHEELLAGGEELDATAFAQRIAIAEVLRWTGQVPDASSTVTTAILTLKRLRNARKQREAEAEAAAGATGASAADDASPAANARVVGSARAAAGFGGSNRALKGQRLGASSADVLATTL